MKSYKVFSSLIAIILALSLMAACGSGSSSNSETLGNAAVTSNSAAYTLKAGHVQSQTHPYHLGLEYFGKLLEDRSGGKIVLEIYPSSQLGSERELTESIQMGTLSCALVGNAVLANFDDTFSVFDLPFLFENRDHAHAVMQSDFCAELYSGLENNDIIGLAWYENGFFDVLSKKEVDVPSDFNGMNIRTMENAAYMNTYTAAGANPVPMAFSEVYTALQNGTVDGVSTSITASVPMKFYEVAPYFLQVDMQFAICNMIFSKEVLDEMPQEYQDLIKECAIESQQYEWDQIAIQEQEGINTINASGGQVKATTDKQAWINAVRDPVYSSSAHADKIDHIRNYDH